MYPVLFRIGAFEITSFGVLVAIGVLAGICKAKLDANPLHHVE
jgi:prolipoprotein diacylglyceryltransferase